MIEIVWGPRFKRAYKKKLKQYPEMKQQLSTALNLFVKNPYHPLLKTHKLGGLLKGSFAFSLGYDLALKAIFHRITEEESEKASDGQ